MKIPCRELPLEQLPPIPPYQPPLPSRWPFRLLMRMAGMGELRATDFRWESVGMERLGKREPALFLMNHSSFIDLKIAAKLLYHRPYHIVCTSDGFVGKEWLMRRLGCIPTRKFTTDATLVRQLVYATRKLRSSVLMFPEASYSFDGTATPLPDSLGKCLKLLKVPVVMITTQGAFAHDPLYNMLQPRKVSVTARMEYLLSPEDIAAKSAEELNGILRQQFSFDNFRWQQENSVRITESFRADGLNRVLYKCPHCLTEGDMEGKGTTLTCHHCGARWELTELGVLRSPQGEERHIPDWYAWERACVRQELQEGRYRLDIPVDIRAMVDMKSLYAIGEGRLVHDQSGFHLTGCDGRLAVTLPPNTSYSLYADYYWYEIGDMICIGDKRALYYCFPKTGGDIVAKARLATEELYKLTK